MTLSISNGDSMPGYKMILCDISEGVLTVTMNRPEVFNALNEAMKSELNDAFRDAAKDRAVRCVVLRGAGEKAFCSGQDLKEHAGSGRSLRDSIEKMYNHLIRKMRTMEKPIIGEKRPPRFTGS